MRIIYESVIPVSSINYIKLYKKIPVLYTPIYDLLPAKLYSIIITMENKTRYGWLIVNQFLQTEKFNEIYDWLLTAAGKMDCHLERKTNAEMLATINDGSILRIIDSTMNPDFILFWDKDVRLAKILEGLGYRLFNRADAIAACDDKSMTFMRLATVKEIYDIPMPETILAPMTYANIGYHGDYSFLKLVEKKLSYPLVIKECFGSFGAQVYLASTRSEAENILERCAGKPLLFQEFIESSYGRDLRLEVVGEEVVATMLRTHDSDFRANITNGGKMSAYTPSTEAVSLAVNVCKALNLDFAGVDLLFGEQDRPILCEVNSNAHFKNIYTCTGVNAADKIMEHILRSLG